MEYSIFEDNFRAEKKKEFEDRYSPYCDLVYYNSSRNPKLRLAMRVLKPAKPSYILVMTHGWHMTIPEFIPMETPQEDCDYLTLQVDMRGRAYSEGEADCNGWELFDVVDAVNFARKNYKEYLIDSSIVYFEGGSGGGGNAYGILGKFPDFFAAATALCGISDYALWYEQDEEGEFRDEMDVWVGCTPSQNPNAYKARSGLHLLENLYTPLFIAHGETDVRVPVVHARNYVKKAKELGKTELIQYEELPNVGNRAHWGNADAEQMERIRRMSEENRVCNRKKTVLPSKGTLIVGGYLFTQNFSVVLESLDKTAVLEYDLPQKKFILHAHEGCICTITMQPELNVE